MLIRLLAVGGLFAASVVTGSVTIKHRFLVMDESRAQLVYVDETDATNNWTISFPGRYRDLQLIGANKLLVSTDNGYREYSLATHQLLKEVKGFSGVTFARRRANGTTVLGGNYEGVTLWELNSEDQMVRHAVFKYSGVRLGRLTAAGTVLFGANTKLVEASLDGQVVREWAIADCKHLYQAVRARDGHLLVSAGYGACLLDCDAAGNVVKRMGGLQAPEAPGLGYHFFAGFQELKNGNRVVANWTGHGATDSAKGVQLIEYDPAGRVVWLWRDAARVGSVHGVLVLDDLDPAVLHDDIELGAGAANGGADK